MYTIKWLHYPIYSNRLHAVWRDKKRVEDERRRKEEEAQKEQAVKNSLKVSLLYSEKDKVSAVVKLRTAARLYDKTTPGTVRIT
jgi:hypothetical protein